MKARKDGKILEVGVKKAIPDKAGPAMPKRVALAKVGAGSIVFGDRSAKTPKKDQGYVPKDSRPLWLKPREQRQKWWEKRRGRLAGPGNAGPLRPS